MYMLEDEAELPTTDMKFTDEQLKELESIDKFRWLVWSIREEMVRGK